MNARVTVFAETLLVIAAVVTAAKIAVLFFALPIAMVKERATTALAIARANSVEPIAQSRLALAIAAMPVFARTGCATAIQVMKDRTARAKFVPTDALDMDLVSMLMPLANATPAGPATTAPLQHAHAIVMTTATASMELAIARLVGQEKPVPRRHAQLIVTTKDTVLVVHVFATHNTLVGTAQFSSVLMAVLVLVLALILFASARQSGQAKIAQLEVAPETAMQRVFATMPRAIVNLDLRELTAHSALAPTNALVTESALIGRVCAMRAIWVLIAP
jgi:hypothetical protein